MSRLDPAASAEALTKRASRTVWRRLLVVALVRGARPAGGCPRGVAADPLGERAARSPPRRRPARAGAGLQEGDGQVHRRPDPGDAPAPEGAGLRPPCGLRDDLPDADPRDAAQRRRARPSIFRDKALPVPRGHELRRPLLPLDPPRRRRQAGPRGLADRLRHRPRRRGQRRPGHAAGHQRARAGRHAVRHGRHGARRPRPAAAASPTTTPATRSSPTPTSRSIDQITERYDPIMATTRAGTRRGPRRAGDGPWLARARLAQRRAAGRAPRTPAERAQVADRDPGPGRDVGAGHGRPRSSRATAPPRDAYCAKALASRST